MIYRISIDTSSARREAANIRATLERELKQIKIDPAIFQASTAEALKLRDAINQIEAEAKQAQTALGNVRTPTVGTSSGVVPTANPVINNGNDARDAAGGIQTLALSYLTLQTAMAGVSKAIELAELSTQAARASKSFEILSGSAGKAQANVIAIQRASSGTISSMTAMQLGTQAAALGLASTTAEFERLVTAARLVVQVSPTIKDLGDAMGQLALFASNETSYMRADQLGLAASEVKDRIKDLQSENENLTGSQAKLEASLQIITEKFGALTSTTEAQATGIEKARVAWTEFQIAVSGSTGPVQGVASNLAAGFNDFAVIIGGTNAPMGVLLGNLERLEEQSRKAGSAMEMTQWLRSLTGEDMASAPQRITVVADALRSAISAVEQGIPGAGTYLGQIQAIATEVDQWNGATNEQVANIQKLSTELNNLIANGGKAQAVAMSAEEAARLAAEQRANSIIEQSGPVGDAVSASANKALEVLGLESTLQLLKDQKLQVDAAIQELIASSVTDPAEITLRLTEIQQAAQSIITDAIENAPELPEIDPGITAGSFDIISQSLADLNNGFVDFLPNMAAARDELISLQTEVALTGITTEEQAAALEYLSSAALAVADDTGILAEVTNGLGIAFLAANPEAAGLVDAMYQAQASYLSGAISADQYAGILAVLGGQLLTLASQAGVATGSILQLIAAQGGLAGTSGFKQGQTIGGTIASRLQAQEGQRARDEARKAAQRAAKEAEAAAKRAGREAESAAKRAGKELERAAKKAADELKAALKSVPGLFGRSPITKEQIDLAKQGVPQNFADDYLRRLEDEVFNKNDWADVSIEEAKAALAKIGITASDNNKAAFEQFAQAWDSSALFADKENLKFINQEAVKLQLDLQEKAKEGQKNIYELFGIAVDEAVDSVADGIGGGGGGGGGGISGGVADLQIPITAALEPIPPITEVPTVKVEPYVDPAAWSRLAMPTQTVQVQPQMIGPMPKPGTMPTLGGMSPVIDVAEIQGQLDSLTINNLKLGETAATTLAAEIEAISASIPVGLYAKLEVMQELADIVEATKISLTPTFTATPTALSEFATVVETQAGISIPVGLYATLETMSELAAIVEMTPISIPVSFVTTNIGDAGDAKDDSKKSFTPTVDTQTIQDQLNKLTLPEFKATAMGLADLQAQIDTFEPKPKIPVTVYSTIESLTDFATIAESTKISINPTFVATPTNISEMAVAVETQAGINIPVGLYATLEVMQELQTIVGGTKVSVPVSLSVVDSEGNPSGDLALGLVGELNRQFETNANFFYAAGQVPATNVMSGYKAAFSTGGNEGAPLVTPMITAINTQIRSQAESLQNQGITMAQYVQSGFTTAFNGEAFKGAIIAAGETMGAYLEIGILSRIRGGALVEAIGAQVLADLTAEVEAP